MRGPLDKDKDRKEASKNGTERDETAVVVGGRFEATT